jgi:hypothetical protein
MVTARVQVTTGPTACIFPGQGLRPRPGASTWFNVVRSRLPACHRDSGQSTPDLPAPSQGRLGAALPANFRPSFQLARLGPGPLLVHVSFSSSNMHDAGLPTHPAEGPGPTGGCGGWRFPHQSHDHAPANILKESLAVPGRRMVTFPWLEVADISPAGSIVVSRSVAISPRNVPNLRPSLQPP